MKVERNLKHVYKSYYTENYAIQIKIHKLNSQIKIHLMNLGPKAIEYLTVPFNDSIISCRIPAIRKSSIVIPIPKPGKDSSLGISYRSISLLCTAAKVMEDLMLTTVNTHLFPAADKHGFRFDLDTQLLHCYTLASDVATCLIKGNRHIERSVSLLT